MARGRINRDADRRQRQYDAAPKVRDRVPCRAETGAIDEKGACRRCGMATGCETD